MCENILSARRSGSYGPVFTCVLRNHVHASRCAFSTKNTKYTVPRKIPAGCIHAHLLWLGGHQQPVDYLRAGNRARASPVGRLIAQATASLQHVPAVYAAENAIALCVAQTEAAKRNLCGNP
jgi:hypothetical protein